MDPSQLHLGLALLAGFVVGLFIGRTSQSKNSAASAPNEQAALLPALRAEKEKIEAHFNETAAALQKVKIEAAELGKERDFLTEKYESAAGSLEKALGTIDSNNQSIMDLTPKYETARSQVAWLKDQLDLEKKQMLDLEKVFADKFSILANKIMDDQNKKFQEFGIQNIGGLLNPLKEKIIAFEKQVQLTYGNESKERALLQQRVQDLIGAQARLTEEANRLSSALRSDSKAQGNWGEIVLHRILEKSGLREGEEFVAQSKGLNLTDENGKGQKPDYLIKLDDGKHLIIDSKVTIRSFESFIHAESEPSRQQHWSEYLKAIGNHIDGLASKHYELNAALRSPEYVLMFMPTEASYALLVDKAPDLVEEAWNKKVIPVGPTNLMACLKAVDTVWKFNRQNKNVEAIMDLGKKALDKFADFTKEIVTVGERIQGAQNALGEATTKLQGKGGMISIMKKMGALGVSSTKPLSKIAADVEPDDGTNVA